MYVYKDNFINLKYFYFQIIFQEDFGSRFGNQDNHWRLQPARLRENMNPSSQAIQVTEKDGCYQVSLMFFLLILIKGKSVKTLGFI